MAALGEASIRRAIAAAAEDLEQYITEQAATHNKRGALVRSIDKLQSPDGLAWDIFHDPQAAPHALFVHWGTKPHIIRPRNKKSLRWPAGDNFAFAKEVHHPGTRSDTWMIRAADLAPRMFAWHIQSLMDK